MIKKLTRTIPPKRGPNPQGLNVPLKQVKIINPENINGMIVTGKHSTLVG